MAIRSRVDASEIVLALVLVLALELDESRAAATPTIQPQARLQPRRRSTRSAPRWGPHKNCHTPAEGQFADSIPAEARVVANIPVQERQFPKVRHLTDAYSRRCRQHSLPPTGWARSPWCLMFRCRSQAKNRRKQA